MYMEYLQTIDWNISQIKKIFIQGKTFIGFWKDIFHRKHKQLINLLNEFCFELTFIFYF